MKARLVKCRADGFDFALDATHLTSIATEQSDMPYAGLKRGTGDVKTVWSHGAGLVVDSVEVMVEAQEILVVPRLLLEGEVPLIGFLDCAGALIPIVTLVGLANWRIQHA